MFLMNMKNNTTEASTEIKKVTVIIGIYEVSTLEDEFSRAQEIGCNNVIYDLSNTESIDSVGLACMMNINKKIKERPKLKNVNTIIRGLLETSELIEDFDVE